MSWPIFFVKLSTEDELSVGFSLKERVFFFAAKLGNLLLSFLMGVKF